MEERWLSLLIWSPGSGWGLRSKSSLCLMLPVVTLLDVASCDATRTNSWDIWSGGRVWGTRLVRTCHLKFQPMSSPFPGWRLAFHSLHLSDLKNTKSRCRPWVTCSSHLLRLLSELWNLFAWCLVLHPIQTAILFFLILEQILGKQPEGQCASAPSEVLAPGVNGAHRIYLETVWFFHKP